MKSIFTSQKVSRRLVVFLLPLLLRFERLQEMLESWMIFERAVPLRNENPLVEGGPGHTLFSHHFMSMQSQRIPKSETKP